VDALPGHPEALDDVGHPDEFVVLWHADVVQHLTYVNKLCTFTP
jgi:hypothetical protein